MKFGNEISRNNTFNSSDIEIISICDEASCLCASLLSALVAQALKTKISDFKF